MCYFTSPCGPLAVCGHIWRCWSGPLCGATACAPTWSLLGLPCSSRTGEITSWHGQGQGRSGGPREGQGMGRRVDRPLYQLPRCCAERLSSEYTHSHRPDSRQTPGAESSEKPPAGCITRPRWWLSRPRLSGLPFGCPLLGPHVGSDHIPEWPPAGLEPGCCPSALEPRGGPETGIGTV